MTDVWRYRIAEWIANPLAAIAWAIMVTMAYIMKKRRYEKA